MKLENMNNSDFLFTYNKSNHLMPRMSRANDLVTVNQEGLGEFIQKVSGFFLEKITSIKEIFSINGKKPTFNIKDFNKLSPSINKLSELDASAQAALKNILIPWIPGIDQDFYQLVTGLVPHLDNIQKNGEAVLEDVDTYLAKIAGDEDFRISKAPSKDLLNTLKKFESNDTVYLETIINGRQMKDVIEIEKALPNFKVLPNIHASLESITDISKVATLEKIADKINRLVDRANGIYTILKQDKTAMSKVKVDELVNVLTYSSKIVINISSLIRLYDAATKVEKALIEKLSKVI